MINKTEVTSLHLVSVIVSNVTKVTVIGCISMHVMRRAIYDLFYFSLSLIVVINVKIISVDLPFLCDIKKIIMENKAKANWSCFPKSIQYEIQNLRKNILKCNLVDIVELSDINRKSEMDIQNVILTGCFVHFNFYICRSKV